jgi:hypothetical protein
MYDCARSALNRAREVRQVSVDDRAIVQSKGAAKERDISSNGTGDRCGPAEHTYVSVDGRAVLDLRNAAQDREIAVQDFAILQHKILAHNHFVTSDALGKGRRRS